MSRHIITAGVLALSSLPALAGGAGCVGNCYTPTYVPPTYGTITEKVVMRAPETYAITTPAQYKTVYDTVQTGGGRYWSVTRDPHTGKLVGCWITKPVSYATVARTVQVSAPQVIPYAVPAVYGYRSQTVQTSAGYKAWAPVSRPVSYGYGGGYGGGHSGGYGGFEGGYGGGASYGLGFGARRGFGGGFGHASRHHGGGFGLGHRHGGQHAHRHGGGFGGHGHGGGKAFAGSGHRGGGKRHF